MKRAVLLTCLAAAGLAAAGTAGFLLFRTNAERSAWGEAVPPEPDLGQAAGELRTRLEPLQTRVAAWPPDIAALGELARLYLANGYQREAEHALTTLCVRDARNPRWPHHLAVHLAGYGRLEEAIPFWRSAATLDPTYTPARIKLADALLKSNRLDEARAAYAAVLRDHPRHPYALLGLGRLEVEEGRWSAARRTLEEAVQADATLSAVHSLLATVAERLGDAAGAETARRRAEALGRFRDVADPWTDALVSDCYDVYRLQVLASTLTATGEARAALPVLERAAALAPADARTQRQLGKLSLRLDAADAAIQAYRRSIELEPGEPTAYLALLDLYRDRRETAAALDVLERGLRACAGSAGLHFERGLAYVAASEWESAWRHFSEARRLEPDNLSAYREAATVAFKLERPEEAVAVLNAALERDAANGPILLMLARYHVQSGDQAAAEASLSRGKKAGAPSRMLEELAGQFHKRFGRAPKN